MILTFALLCSTVTLVIYYVYNRFLDRYNFWQKKRVAFLKPTPLIGNLLPVLQFKYSIGDVYREAYWQFPEEKAVGVYSFSEPILVIRDPNLIAKILIKDFNYFEDQVPVANSGELLSNTLFQLKGNTWRSLRYQLNSCFTTSKLRQIFNKMLQCTDELLNNIESNLPNDINIKDVLATFNTDVVTNCVFGIELDRKANKIFSKTVLSIFDTKPLSLLKILIVLNFPKMASILGLSFMSNRANRYLREFIKKTFEQRANGRQQNSNDYLQLLLNLKEKGTIEMRRNEFLDKHSKKDSGAVENIEITDNLLAGQAFQFLAGGFDPVNNAMVFTLYEIAKNPKVQESIRKEIKDLLKKHGGYSFDAIKEMTYLEHCIQETLRFFPLLPFLFRTCSKSYVTSEGLEIDKGQKLAIPLTALHMDPKYFPEPHKFDPRRYDGLNSNTYLPFGDGPRICLGMKFAMVEIKLGLAKIVENYKFKLSQKTKQPLELNKQAVFIKPKYDVYLDFENLF